ncbi:MAG: recombinase family protein [Ruminococcaceae bacterium]|nr:recombinase family protein [Oscillospiraceae bacterium]
MTRKSKVAAYVRESRDEHQKNIRTLENQIEILKDFINKNPEWLLYDVYKDDNVSGTTFQRPELSRLIKDAENNKIDIILVKDLSRLGRNNAQTLLFLDWAEEKGIQIITSDGRYDSSCNTELAGIDTWFNERYAADISRKIRASLKMKINAGEYIGSSPYGYCKKSPGKLTPKPEEALVVKEIYNLYISGLGYEKIAINLNQKGISAPKTNWTPQTIKRILNSPVYIGTTVQGTSKKQSFKSKKTIRLPEKEWVITENTHEAIIDRSDFEKVQFEIKKRMHGAGNNKGKIPILKNILFCGYCGEKMYSKGNGYICSRYVKQGAESCRRNFHFTENISRLIFKEILIKIRKANFSFETKTSNQRKLLDLAEKNYKRKIEILYSDRINGIISEDFFLEIKRKEEAVYNEIIQKNKKEKKNSDYYIDLFLKEDFETIPQDILRRIFYCMVEKCIVK